MKALTFLFCLLAMSACGSPLFDHEMESRPNASAGGAPSTAATAKSSLQSWLETEQNDCLLDFNKLGICVSFSWEDPLTLMSADHNRLLYFRIWRKDEASFSLDEEPRLQVDMPEGCCVHAPPVIEPLSVDVSLATSGQYFRAREIYFMKSGLYELRLRLYTNGNKQTVIHAFRVD